MVNINFVPEDYIEQKESSRTNLMYLTLLVVVFVGLSGSFLVIKFRQDNLGELEQVLDKQLTEKKEQIAKVEQLQEEGKLMLKTAVTTSELLDPVAKSVVLSLLTNNLPKGASLINISLIQKQSKKHSAAVPLDSKYKNIKSQKAKAMSKPTSKEKLLETYIDIEGIAPSDLEVAAYIKNLSSWSLMDYVDLVESREYINPKSKSAKNSAGTLRQFKLKVKLKDDVQIRDKDIEEIALLASNTVENGK